MADGLNTYSKRAIRLHWISALLILIEWPLGKFGVDGDGSTTDLVNALHIWIGLAVCGLTIWRVVYHFTGPKVEDLPMPTWEKWLFKINHTILYLALLGASLTGVAMLVSSGQLPPFTGSVKMEMLEEATGGELHEAPTTVLMFMFVMHVAGVVYYQVLHGRTLRRMGVPVPK